MMKKVLCAGLIVLLTLGAFYVLYISRYYMKNEKVRFPATVDLKADGQRITLEPTKIPDPKKPGKDLYVFFLPAFAGPETAVLNLNTFLTCTLSGRTLRQATPIGEWKIGETYSFSVGPTVYSLQFQKSGNAAASFITTASRDIEKLHETGYPTEEAALTVITAEGKLNYASGSVKDRVKCAEDAARFTKKKSFLLTLASASPLLGLPEGASWKLLSPGFDETKLRDRLGLSMASKMGFSRTPDSVYTDVYVNGDYRGLYLLSETPGSMPVSGGAEDSPEVSAGKKTSGMVLYEATDESNIPAGEGFTLKEDRSFFLHFPGEEPDETEKETLLKKAEERMSAVGKALYRKDWKTVEKLIDMDSWARSYLFDEVLQNPDAERCGTFYYTDLSDPDGLIYAGPQWNFAVCMGNTAMTDAELFDAPNHLVTGRTYWYPKLNELPEFRKRVKQIYKEEFEPLLKSTIESGIDELAAFTAPARAMEAVRYGNDLPAVCGSSDEAIRKMREFLSARRDFLTDYWLGTQHYHAVVLTVLDRNYEFFVPEGAAFAQFPTGRDVRIGRNILGWVLADGSAYDMSAPVTENLRLKAVLQ